MPPRLTSTAVGLQAVVKVKAHAKAKTVPPRLTRTVVCVQAIVKAKAKPTPRAQAKAAASPAALPKTKENVRGNTCHLLGRDDLPRPSRGNTCHLLGRDDLPRPSAVATPPRRDLVLRQAVPSSQIIHHQQGGRVLARVRLAACHARVRLQVEFGSKLVNGPRHVHLPIWKTVSLTMSMHVTHRCTRATLHIAGTVALHESVSPSILWDEFLFGQRSAIVTPIQNEHGHLPAFTTVRPAVAAMGVELPQLIHQLANLLLGICHRLVGDKKRLVAHADRQFVHLAQNIRNRAIAHLSGGVHAVKLMGTTYLASGRQGPSSSTRITWASTERKISPSAVATMRYGAQLTTRGVISACSCVA